jgi:S-formylglutathione hydrolase
MYTYVTEELPALVEKYFHVSSEKKSLMGHSMGGNGALMIAARNPQMFKCFSAFAPIASPSSIDSLYVKECLTAYFGSPEAYKPYDA